MVSLIQTAEGALNETHDILQRMRELAVQSSNDTNTTSDREELGKELGALTDEIDRISEQTEFNTKKLLNGPEVEATAEGEEGNGSANSVSFTFHIGANKGQDIDLNINSMSSSELGINDLDISSQQSADGAIETIQEAIDQVSGERSNLGAVQNRLEHTINNLGTSSENLTAAESRIRDVDMAEEMMNFTKNNILSQASQSMLAQSQQMPQGVLQLLQ